MDDPKDSWEALFNHNYLRWFHLNGAPSLVEIVEVTPNVKLTLPGGAKSVKPVLYYKQIRGKMEQADHERPAVVNGKETKDVVFGWRPLVLNVTNGNEIAKLHGGKWKSWPGKQIEFFQDETRMFDMDTRQMVTKQCVRIRPPTGGKANTPPVSEKKQEPAKPANHDTEVAALLVALDKVTDQAGLDALSPEVKRLWGLIDQPSKTTITNKSGEVKARIAKPAASDEPSKFQAYHSRVSITVAKEPLMNAIRDEIASSVAAGELTPEESEHINAAIDEKLKAKQP